MAKKNIKDKEPIYVTDKKDPRLLAYIDSLNLYNLDQAYFKALDKSNKDSIKKANLKYYNNSNVFEKTPERIKLQEAISKLDNYENKKNEKIKNEPKEKNPIPIVAVNSSNTIQYSPIFNSAYKKPVQPVKLKKLEPVIQSEVKKEVLPIQPQQVEPIYVTDKKDPRLLAYNDSLIMYNAFKGHINALTKAKDFDDWSKTFNTVNYSKTDPAYNYLTKINKKSPKPIAKKERIFDNLGESGCAEEYKKPVQPIKYKKKELPLDPITEQVKNPILPVQNTLPIENTLPILPKTQVPKYAKRQWVSDSTGDTYQYLDKTGKELGRETYQKGKLVTPAWYDNNIMNSADNVGQLKYGGMKKNKNTTPRILNPYISLFDLGGLKAEKPEMTDLGEVNDTNIARNLKFPSLEDGKDKTSGFDMKKLAGLSPEGNALTNSLNNAMGTTDNRGVVDTGKSTLNAGIGTTASTFSKAISVTGEPISAGAIALTAGTIAAFGANKKAKAANKELSQDYGNYYAGLPKMTSANPYKMAMGGNKLKTSEQKNTDDAYFQSLEDMKYGKYIEDPIKRKNQIKNVFWNMLDNGFDPNNIESDMRNMGSYGSQRGGIASTAGTWGWDSKDIDQKDLVNYYNEYHNIKPNNVKQERGSQTENVKKEMQQPLLNKFKMGGSKLLNEYNGATHENGGIALTTNIEVEDREVTPPITSSLKDYVFSNSLLVPGKKTTIATAVKREIYPYKNRENDPYAKRAMEQIYEKYKNINEMQKAVAEKKQAHAQELEEIQRKFGGYKLIKGGKKSIGILPDMENDNSFVDYNVGEGSLPDMYKQAYLPKSEQVPNMNFGPETGRNKPVLDDPYRLGNAEDYFPESSDKNNTTTNNTKKKSKIGNEEMALGLSMLPGIYNVAKGWKPDSTNFQNMNPNLVNLESERENLRREAGKARLIANENVRQIGGGSGSALAALATQSSAINDSKMKGLSDSYQREHLANVTTLNDFLVRNTGIINEEYVANEQNKAMSDSLKGLGLSDLSNNGQGYLRDKELNRANEKSNKMKLDAMNSLFPNYKWGIDPETDKMVLQYMESFGGTGGLGAYTGTSNKATKSNAKGTTTTTSTSSNTKSGATTKKTTTTKKG